MLKEVVIKNFKSFKDEMFFSMEALNGILEHKNHIMKINKNDILKVASIYGPNGGGKSNILSSVSFLKDILILDLKSERPIPNTNQYHKPSISDIYKKFADNNDKTLSTSYVFVNDEFEFIYDLELETDDTSNALYLKVLKEELSYRSHNQEEFIQLFNRYKTKINGDLILNSLSLQDTFELSQNKIFLTYIKNFEQITKLNNELNIVNSFLDEINKIKFYSGTSEFYRFFDNRNFKKLSEDNEFKLKYLKLLKIFDIGITDLRVECKNDEQYKLYCIHKKNDTEFELDYYSESAGTRGIIQMIPEIINTLDNKTILLVDELDSKLHPKITRKIVEIFNSKDNKNSQIIFNSHDIINMDNELFRRDEIWFSCLKENLSSDVFSLCNIINYKGQKIRNDAKYGKQYLEGKYGSDPFIEKGFTWNV